VASRTHLSTAPSRKLGIVAGALTLFLAACGGGDDEPADAGSGASLGGVGHWTAAELCALSDTATVGAMFPGVEVAERAVVDSDSLSQCGWGDASVQWGTRDHELVGVRNGDHAGQQFGSPYEPIDVAGADPAVFALQNPADEGKSTLIAVVGDQRLTIDFNGDAVGGREVAASIATTWAAAQNG